MAPLQLDDVEFQIKKACQIYKRYPKPYPKNPHSCLANVIKPNPTHLTNSPLMPSPEEIDMADTVQFVWLNWLTPTEKRLLWRRYDGVPWKILAYEENLTIRQARYKVQKSLEKILSKLIKINKKQ